VQYRALDSAEAAALDTAFGGAAFSELCDALVPQAANEDQVPLVAASFLKRWVVDHCVVDARTA
jgi:hypothetical protein